MTTPRLIKLASSRRLRDCKILHPCFPRFHSVDKPGGREPQTEKTSSRGTASGWPHDIASSSYVKAQKSTFVAHSTRLTAASDLPGFISHLKLSSSRLKRATHCMHAFRVSADADGKASGVTCGQSDGGENGAGSLLASVLEKGECVNAVVVVWRWYGGVKLGGERWRVIGHVAREALRGGGFLKEGNGPARTAVKGKSNIGKRR